jgi:AcrR family transcriptional regulator
MVKKLNIPKKNKNKGDPWWHLWKCCLCKCHGRGEKTRQKLLQFAFDEIHKVGFQAASLSKILKDTGITKGALYHHFGNKLELGYAVVDEIILAFFQQVWIDPLRKTDDPISTLQKILSETGDKMTHKDARFGCPVNNLVQEMSPIDEGFRQRTVAIYDTWRDELEAAIERGKVAGNVREEANARRLAILFVATFEGCLGLDKSSQSLDILMECNNGLIEHLELFRR